MKSDYELSDFLIESPYELIDEDRLAIRRAIGSGVPHKDQWSKSCLEVFKEHVKEYYDDVQNGRCAYCRMKVSLATGYYHIEHIAPKSLYPQWMYEPLNLCLACPNCNSAKSAKDIMSISDVDEIPIHSDAYLIINPHIDKYFEHIEIIDGLLYRGITDKGKFTIEVCHLTRVELLTERAEKLIEDTLTPGTFEKIMMTYVLHPECIDDMDAVTTKIRKIIKKITSNTLFGYE